MMKPWISTSFPLSARIASVTWLFARIASTSWAKVSRGASAASATVATTASTTATPSSRHRRKVVSDLGAVRADGREQRGERTQDDDAHEHDPLQPSHGERLRDEAAATPR